MTQSQPQTGRSASSSSVDLYAVDPKMLDQFAPYVVPELARATDLTGGMLTPAHVLELCRDRTWVLWVVIDSEAAEQLAVAVTGISVAQTGVRICTVWLCAGYEMSRWRHLLPELEEYARREGASVMEIHGRRGWEKVYPEYREAFRVLQKEII